MLMLGVSTSSKNPSAAVMRDGVLVCCKTDDSGRSHSAVLMELIDEALAEAKAGKSDLDAIAVDIGPGSFTGVRIGVSCVNAMAFALGRGVLPVCSLAALRHAVPKDGKVCALLDARNGNGYAAVYEDGEEILSPCPCVIADILAEYPADETNYVGDVKDICSDERPNAALVLAEAWQVYTRAGESCFAHLYDTAGADAARVSEAVPMYLRPSQAERTRGS